jgi:hypothetical protein
VKTLLTPELVDRIIAALDPSDGGAEVIADWLRAVLSGAGPGIVVNSRPIDFGASAAPPAEAAAEPQPTSPIRWNFIEPGTPLPDDWEVVALHPGVKFIFDSTSLPAGVTAGRYLGTGKECSPWVEQVGRESMQNVMFEGLPADSGAAVMTREAASKRWRELVEEQRTLAPLLGLQEVEASEDDDTPQDDSGAAGGQRDSNAE